MDPSPPHLREHVTVDAAVTPPVSSLFGIVLSLAFWTAFLLASGLFAILALGPRIVTLLELRGQLQSNSAERAAVQGEIDHLSKLATALESDPEFVRRLADEEFRPTTQGETRIPVDAALNFDARVPTASAPIGSSPPSVGPLTNLLSAIAEQPRLGRNLQWTLLAVVLFSFACLNEDFFSRGFGSRLRVAGLLLASRYRVPRTEPDGTVAAAMDVPDPLTRKSVD